MSDTGSSLDLSFLSRDVQSQIESSRSILEQVRLLRSSLNKIENEEARAAIQTTINNLLSVVDNISANVENTTASSGSAFGPLFRK